MCEKLQKCKKYVKGSCYISFIKASTFRYFDQIPSPEKESVIRETGKLGPASCENNARPQLIEPVIGCTLRSLCKFDRTRF